MWSSALVDDVLDTSSFITSNDILIYPNPTSKFITISVPDVLQASLRLFDVSGKLLQYHKDVVLNGSYSLSIEKETTGVYFLRIITSKGTYEKGLENGTIFSYSKRKNRNDVYLCGEKVMKNGILLGCHSRLTLEQVNFIGETIGAFMSSNKII